MFKTISRTIILVFVLMFGSVVATSASVKDINDQGQTNDQQRWNKQSTIQYILKTYFGKWNQQWSKHHHNHYKKEANKPTDYNKETENQNNVTEEKPKEEVNKQDVNEKDQGTVEKQQEEQTNTDALNSFEQQVVELTNKERAKANLAPLTIDEELSRVAREKSRDMAINYYFNHQSPVYGSPFDMIRAYGINYQTAGENIAKGQRSPEEVVQAWMNSQGHRENILNSSFTHIGVGFYEQGNHWTQMFIGK